MDQDTIIARHRAHWKPGFGTVAADELGFIQELIERHRPERFIEVGMASGMSTGFIASFMDEHGGKVLVSIDHDDEFFGDKTKPNGFLVPELYPGGDVEVSLMKFKTALDTAEFDDAYPGGFDMAFIDANHQHPWPAIDTMCLYPRMRGPKIVIHHDLRLFMAQDVMFGIGPKYLFDQFPESHRERAEANGGNIFAVDLSLNQDRFERLMTDLLKLPWSLRSPIQDRYVAQIREVLAGHYSSALAAHFDRCLKTYNILDRFRSGL